MNNTQTSLELYLANQVDRIIEEMYLALELESKMQEIADDLQERLEYVNNTSEQDIIMDIAHILSALWQHEVYESQIQDIIDYYGDLPVLKAENYFYSTLVFEALAY